VVRNENVKRSSVWSIISNLIRGDQAGKMTTNERPEDSERREEVVVQGLNNLEQRKWWRGLYGWTW
jgi:hypothetical protein